MEISNEIIILAKQNDAKKEKNKTKCWANGFSISL